MSDTSSENLPVSTNAVAIEEAAAAWIRRRHFWSWSTENQAELDAWINQSAAHEVAYLRLEAAWNRAERLAALRPSKKGRAGGASSNWKTLLRVAAGIVFVAALSVGGAAYYLSPKGTVYTTPVGGHRTLLLSDGSRIELNTDSILRLESGERTVSLERGEAYFDIKHDAAHPFSVRTANHRVIDVGTVFVVRNDAGKTQVTLVEGEARLEFIDDPHRPQSALLTAGDVAVATADKVSITKEPVRNLTKELSWRRGVLVFDNTPLAEAANELNRYNTQKLIVADNAVGRTRIDASIPVNGVEVLARIARDVFGVRVETRGNEVILLCGNGNPSNGK